MKNTTITSSWQTWEQSQAFIQGIRGAMPGATMQPEIILNIVECWCEEPRSILDLGCGDGILGSFLLKRYPKARGVFMDFSVPMLEAAREKLNEFSDISIIEADFSTAQWLEEVVSSEPFDIVVSGFAIHHQPDQRKYSLFKEIYDLLGPGGVFLNMEHVASLSKAGEELFDTYFIDHLYHHYRKSDDNASREKIAENYHGRPDKEENILASVDKQCQWLKEIGYSDVDCFFKIFELALFGGRKLQT